MGYNQERYDRWEAMEAAMAWDAAHPNDDDGFDKLRDLGAFDNERFGTMGVTVYSVDDKEVRDNG